MSKTTHVTTAGFGTFEIKHRLSGDRLVLKEVGGQRVEMQPVTLKELQAIGWQPVEVVR